MSPAVQSFRVHTVCALTPLVRYSFLYESSNRCHLLIASLPTSVRESYTLALTKTTETNNMAFDTTLFGEPLTLAGASVTARAGCDVHAAALFHRYVFGYFLRNDLGALGSFSSFGVYLYLRI